MRRRYVRRQAAHTTRSVWCAGRSEPPRAREVATHLFPMERRHRHVMPNPVIALGTAIGPSGYRDLREPQLIEGACCVCETFARSKHGGRSTGTRSKCAMVNCDSQHALRGRSSGRRAPRASWALMRAGARSVTTPRHSTSPRAVRARSITCANVAPSRQARQEISRVFGARAWAR